MMGEAGRSTPDEKYYEHVREAAHQASQDFDALIAKLGTAGLTVTAAIVGFTDAPRWDFLAGGAIAFALALFISLITIRLSADGLRTLGSKQKRYEEIKVFNSNIVVALNWTAAILLGLAYLLLALHLVQAVVLEEAR